MLQACRPRDACKWRRQTGLGPPLQCRCPRNPAPTRAPAAPPCRVTAVNDGTVDVQRKDGSRDVVPFGTCVWATGIAMHPFVAGLKAKLPEELQTSRR